LPLGDTRGWHYVVVRLRWYDAGVRLRWYSVHYWHRLTSGA
jgi:hypothetical protein